MLRCVQLRARFSEAREVEEILAELPADWDVIDESHPTQLSIGIEGGRVIETPESLDRAISVHLEERVGRGAKKRTVAYNVYLESEVGLEFWKAYFWNPEAGDGETRSKRSIPLGRTIVVVSADPEGNGEVTILRGGGRDDVVKISERHVGSFRGVRSNWSGKMISGSIDREIEDLERQIFETIEAAKKLR